MQRREVSVKSQEIGQSQFTSRDHQEVEWQFDGADLDSAEDWLGEDHEGLGLFIEPGEEKELRDVYYATAD
jgi:hypothetical protein